MRQGCTKSFWFFTVYMDAVMKEVKIWMGRREESGILYIVDMVLCGESDEDLWVIVGRIV